MAISQKKDNLKVDCYKCKKQILVKWVYSKKDYSRKNDWGWWTEKEENKGKYICNKCLLNLYNNKKTEYLDSVKNPTKRATMRNYISIFRIKA